LPNLIVESKNNNPSDEQSPEACLRRFRSAVRSSGLGEAEALVFLPARRLSLILRGSPLATFQPGPSKSLQNRRYLHHLLDYQRSLSLLSGLVENNSLASSSEELPAPQRVLVLAPHFDDECLLFGQQILNAARAGSEVRVVWMTDGGNESSVRHAEGLAALKVLGVEDSACLQAPESRLTAKGPWVSELRRHLTEFCPQEIMLPWWPDNHVDHFEVTRVLKAAWQPRLQDCNLRLSGFWTPLPFGECCPLNPKVADALKTHKSQLTGVNYLRVFQGLSCWHGDGQRDMSRSWLLPSKEYFSAFRRSGVGKRRYRINA
jgi:hypothetical protein